MNELPPGQSGAGKAMVASGAVLVVVGIVVAFAVSPWGGIAAVVGIFDIILGIGMQRGAMSGWTDTGGAE